MRKLRYFTQARLAALLPGLVMMASAAQAGSPATDLFWEQSDPVSDLEKPLR
jgi:hypothetical protein